MRRPVIRLPFAMGFLRHLAAPWPLAPWVLALCLSTLGGLGALGAPRAARADVRREVAADTIRGFVFDSLLHAPIADATVIASPGGEQVMTAKDGRYSLVSAQKIARLNVYHHLLERTGIGSLSVAVGPSASRAQFVISTPSFQTLWKTLCGAATIVEGRGGIVHGTARSSDNSTRVAGARVRVSWDVDETTLKNPTLPRVIETRTDKTGAYAACGVPPLADVYVVSYSPEFSSGTLLLAADSLPLRKQELVVGPPGQTAIVRGTARDQRSQPLGNVMVEVDGLPGSWTSDAQGRFALSAIPTGTRTILARALGYAPVIQQVDVLAKDNEDIAISMTRSTRLPNVTVNAVADKGPVVREYEERKKRGFGWFTDSLQFKNRADTRSIFQGAPGLQIDADNSRSLSEFKIYMPYTMGHCLANIYLDGFRSDAQMLSGLPKQQIAAVEVYMRPGEVPGKYLPFDSICGTVLVWTKQAFEPPPAKKAKKL